MKNKSEQKRLSFEKQSTNKKDKNISNQNNFILKNQKDKSSEKMVIKVDEKIQQEIEKEKVQEKRQKSKIFNNKKNNNICSDLLKTTINQEKELILIPYAKEKQKINKTLNTIGNAHGIPYPNCSVIKGFLTKDRNYLAIIREGDKKIKIKNNKLKGNNNKQNKVEINLESNFMDNKLKEMLGNAENIKNFI